MTTWPPTPEGEQEPVRSPPQTELRRFLDWLFAVPTGKRTVWTIIGWWERRRIPYNLIVGAIGIVSLLLFFFFITQSGSLKSSEDAVEPMAIIAAPFLMNIAYCAGAGIEILLFLFGREQSRGAGSILLRLGLGFSLFVVCVPSVLWGIAWIVHLF